MENNNANNYSNNQNSSDWGVYQPAVPNNNYQMTTTSGNMRNMNNTNNMNNVANDRFHFMNDTARRILNNSSTQTRPRAALIDNTLSIPNNLSGTNSSMNCTGSNCSYTPETVTNEEYFPAYLKNFIGYWARIDFLIGNNIEQRVGQILEVGASYVLINVLEPETIMLCDLYSIKFVTIILSDEIEKLYLF